MNYSQYQFDTIEQAQHRLRANGYRLATRNGLLYTRMIGKREIQAIITYKDGKYTATRI